MVIVIRNQLSQIQAWRICVKTGAWKSLYWKIAKNIRKKRQANYKREEGCCASSSSLFFIFRGFTEIQLEFNSTRMQYYFLIFLFCIFYFSYLFYFYFLIIFCYSLY